MPDKFGNPTASELELLLCLKASEGKVRSEDLADEIGISKPNLRNRVLRAREFLPEGTITTVIGAKGQEGYILNDPEDLTHKLLRDYLNR